MLPETVVAKMFGAFSGSVIALIFILPKTRTEFVRRVSASLIVGPIASPVVLNWLEWPANFDNFVASAAIASFASWWLLGAVLAALKKAIETKAE